MLRRFVVLGCVAVLVSGCWSGRVKVGADGGDDRGGQTVSAPREDVARLKAARDRIDDLEDRIEELEERYEKAIEDMSRQKQDYEKRLRECESLKKELERKLEERQ